MKTQILTLDTHDDVISVRDKMAWGQTGRILLVWPEHSQILTRRIDLILLQRHSASMGAQLALVTDHPQVTSHAGQLGLPVFRTPLEAQTAHWRSSRRRKVRPRRRALRPDLTALRQEAHPPAPAWMSHPAARLVPFALSVLALLILTGFLLPAAQITLTPQASSQKVSLPVSASADIQSVNLAGWLPARAVSVIVEAQDSQASSGTALIPVQAASGSVRFTNLTSQSVTIPQGTVVSTLGASPIRFATTREVTAPGGPGLSITASVRALQPGASGNLPASSLTAIEGDLELSLSATNLSATSGGADSPAPAPTVLDQDALSQRIQATLQQAALEDLQASLAQGDYLLAPSLTIVQVIEESILPPQGQAGEQVEMTLQVEYSALVVSAADLQALVTPILDASLPQGFIALPGSLAITPASAPTLDDEGTAHWNIQASRAIQAEISTAQAVNLALGRPILQATQSMAAELPLGAPPQVSVSPSWWPRLPFLPLRIQVTILDAQGEVSGNGVLWAAPPIPPCPPSRPGKGGYCRKWVFAGAKRPQTPISDFFSPPLEGRGQGVGCNMRILAVDPGEKRLGIAISDPTGTIANPLTVLQHVARAIDAAAIADLARQHQAGQIVIGQALDDDGQATPQSRRAVRLAEAVQMQCDLPIALWDESGSTQAARQARIAMGVRRSQRRGHLDDLAATVILQSYLDAHAHQD